MTGYSLHIGLNHVDTSSYVPAPAVLAGCINDANDMQQLAAGQGFLTRVLLDAQATSGSVLTALADMARATQPGDIALITYSGHGGQIFDSNSDEADGYDETWCLFDRQVLDDELHRMYAQFPAGTRIVVASDSCHSGTVARMILALATREALVRNPLGREFWPPQVEVPTMRPRSLPMSACIEDSLRRRDLYQSVQALAGGSRNADISAELILISGCMDNQLSSDGDQNGLFTEALLAVWQQGSFSGDYRAFHSAIVRRMPPDQTPNFATVGPVTQNFQAQRPFTVTAPVPSSGGGSTGPGGQDQGTQGGTSRPTLRRGASGDDVRHLQQKLVDHGAWLSVDGSFGIATEGAVRTFQRDHGLSVDGIVGAATWAALEGSPGSGGAGGTGTGGTTTGGGWGEPEPTPGGTSGGTSGGGTSGGGTSGGGTSSSGTSGGGTSGGGTSSGDWGSPGTSGGGTSSAGPAPTRPTLRRGATGEHVRHLQQRLAAWGYVLTVDGSFGPGTESQVRSFQRSQGLVADGVVGQQTWAALG